MANDVDLCRRIAECASKKNASLAVHILSSRVNSSYPYEIAIYSNTQFWPCPFVRGGFSTRALVGYCKSKETAEKRAKKLIAELQKLKAAM